MEGVPLPGVGNELDPPALEEHHRGVNPPLAGRLDPATEPLEVRRVELRQVELWLAVQRVARTGPGIRVRLDRVPPGPAPLPHVQVPVGQFPGPEPGEVVAVAGQVVEVGTEIELRGRIGFAVVDDVSPGVRAGQVDRPAGGIGEVAAVFRMDPQRPGGRRGSLGGRRVPGKRQVGCQGGAGGAKTGLLEESASVHSALLMINVSILAD